jgi:YD repeat-containing protein
VILNTPLNTKETFIFRQNPDRFVGLGTSSLLARSGDGPTEEYTLSSRHGVVSKFFGFDPSMPTPGRVKTITDRYGNSQLYQWQLASEPGPCPLVQLARVTDPYGRQIVYRYYNNDPNAGYRLQEIEDFLGRKLTFQYENGHLVAVMLPVLNQTVSGNEFPLGTAYVFQYEDDCDGGLLTKIWFPNQATPFIEEPSPGVRAVKLHGQGGIYDTATAIPRYTVSYYLNSQVSAVTIGDPNPASGVGGTIFYNYADLAQGAVLNAIEPGNDIPSEGRYRELKKRITVTDRNGNITESYLDALGRTWKRVVKANRNKNSLQAAEYVTWFQYNPLSQLILVVFPKGNSVSYSYESGAIPGTMWTVPEPYTKRVGLLRRQDRKPDNPKANMPPSYQIPANHNTPMNGLLSLRYYYEPLFNQLCATSEERGNPIDLMGNYFFPQNSGQTPTDSNRSRYATLISFDYQKNTSGIISGDPVVQGKLLLNSSQILSLISYVNTSMISGAPDDPSGGGIPSGFPTGLGDINGDGEGGLTPTDNLGRVVRIVHPSVLIYPDPVTTQDRVEIFTTNKRGQVSTHTDPEGNVTVIVRHPYNEPDGVNVTPGETSVQLYGFVKEVHVDVDPGQILGLVGTGANGDLVGFTLKVPRLNTPGVYQDLLTDYPAYDQLMNPLAVTNPRGYTTVILRTELGEAYQVTSPDPYQYQRQLSYDANRNLTQEDIQDRQPQLDSTMHFVPDQMGDAYNVPTVDGPGGLFRQGYFVNAFQYDLLDDLIQATLDDGVTAGGLVTVFSYDRNQNRTQVTKPEGNIVEYDYDERNLLIAQRVGRMATFSGALTVAAYDMNGNLMIRVDPLRGNPGDSCGVTVTIGKAFGSMLALVHTGDFALLNTLDGFDRVIAARDAVGGIVQLAYDPGSRVIGTTHLGTVGGPSPTDLTGGDNKLLAHSLMRFDEAGREYETEQEVFVPPDVTLASGRSVTQIFGGLQPNNPEPRTGSYTLVSNGTGTGTNIDSYVLMRHDFDQLGLRPAVPPPADRRRGRLGVRRAQSSSAGEPGQRPDLLAHERRADAGGGAGRAAGPGLERSLRRPVGL